MKAEFIPSCLIYNGEMSGPYVSVDMLVKWFNSKENTSNIVSAIINDLEPWLKSLNNHTLDVVPMEGIVTKWHDALNGNQTIAIFDIRVPIMELLAVIYKQQEHIESLKK